MATFLPIGPITRCRSRSGAKATKVPAPSSASGTSSCGSMTASSLVQSSSAGTRSMLQRTVSNYSPVTRPDAASMTSSSSSSGSCQNSWRSAASPTRRRQASRQTTSWPRHSLERSGVVGPWWWPAATGQEEDIALLFTDVVLPGGTNGRALPEEVVRRRPSSRVLFTTGYTKNAIVHHGRLDPDIELLGKPFTYSELASKVRALINSRERSS